MKVLKAAQVLRDFYDKNRAVGHTQLLQQGIEKGIEDKEFLVLGAHEHQARMLCKSNKERAIPVSIENLGMKLKAKKLPLAIDNSFMHQFTREVAKELEEYKELKREVVELIKVFQPKFKEFDNED
jgi:hypothetical protein